MQRNIVNRLKPFLFLFLLFLVITGFPKFVNSVKTASQNILLSPVKVISIVKSRFSPGASIRKDNKILKEKLAYLTAKLSALEEVRQENERLRKLLKFKDDYSAKSIPAEVIGRDPVSWMEAVIINKGASEGISENMAVATYLGLVGRVSEVSKHTSKVMLISDLEFRAAVRLKDIREDGILQGLGGSLCKMIYISEDAEVSAGEEVLTSSLGGMFPPGLPVGSVVKADREKGRLYKYAVIKPFQNLSSVEEVLCIK